MNIFDLIEKVIEFVLKYMTVEGWWVFITISSIVYLVFAVIVGRFFYVRLCPRMGHDRAYRLVFGLAVLPMGFFYWAIFALPWWIVIPIMALCIFTVYSAVQTRYVTPQVDFIAIALFLFGLAAGMISAVVAMGAKVTLYDNDITLLVMVVVIGGVAAAAIVAQRRRR